MYDWTLEGTLKRSQACVKKTAPRAVFVLGTECVFCSY